MTENKNKRFVYMNLLEVEAISDNDEECYYFNEYGTVKKICGLLNNLDDKNNQLIVTNNGLNAEYEWLKEEKQRLYEDNIRIKQLVTTAFNKETDEHTRDVLKGIIEMI